MKNYKPILFTLSNGIRVAYIHADTEVAHLGVTMLAGSRFEEEHEVGLAHFLEHCIFKGTTKRKSHHILSRLDSVGGELNAFTTKEEICVYASFVVNHFKRASELLADIIQNSDFPEKEVIKEKEIVLDELNSYMDNPSEKIYDDFESYLFKGHPLGNNILGTKESLESFTKDHLRSYIDKYFVANNMAIGFVGDLPIEKLKQILEKDYGQIKSNHELKEPTTFLLENHFQINSKEANFQSHTVLGGVAPGYNDEHRRAMTLLINVLGGPALNSRLLFAVREKYGYTYNIEANYSPYADTGYFSIYFGTDEKYLHKTKRIVYKEIKKLRDVALTPIQLHKAKEQLKGHIALSMDNNSGVMLGLGKSLLLFNQIDTMQEIYHEIDKLTSAELQEVAQKYMSEERMSELVFETTDQ